MAGMAFGIGVGPGDPELVTLKALRIMRACDVVAFPGKDAATSRAYRIALGCLPELREKDLLALPAPMVSDREAVEAAQAENARRVEGVLDSGRDVAILVLGDPSLYSTFGYMRRVLVDDGYRVETVSGVPSFCAAAARLGVPLAEWDEQLHVVPLARRALDPKLTGMQVLMKPGGRMGELRDYARTAGLELRAIENCGMDDERVYHSADDVPDRTGYLTVALLRSGRSPED